MPAAGEATATDACGTPTISSALGNITSNGCSRSQTRTYTATDACGNSSTCTQVFTWKVDLDGPVFSGISDYIEIEGSSDNGICAQDLSDGGIASVIDKKNNANPIANDKVHFDQPRNQGHPIQPLDWTNGVNNITHSEYFEGMGVPQRILFTQLIGSTHTFRFRHEAVKHQSGDRHAYDFLMSWEQAIATAGNIGNGSVNELQNLIAQQCTDLTGTTCLSLTNNAYATLTDNMGNPPNHHGNNSVNNAIDCFEDQYGERQIEIKGNAPISNFNINFEGYSGAENGDNYAWYTVNWRSTSSSVMIKLAGRAAQGGGACGYGNCYGAGSISGAPYHFKLELLDGHSLGNRDNQLMVDKSCDVNIPVQFGTPNVSDGCDGGQIQPTIVNSDVVTVNPDGSKTHCRTWQATDSCGNSRTFTQCIKVTCSGSSAKFNGTDVIETSLVSDSLKIKVYPNPYTDNFKLDVKTANTQDLQVRVYDLLGRLMETNNVKMMDIETFAIGNNYPAGVYNVIVTQGTEVKTQRVIKE